MSIIIKNENMMNYIILLKNIVLLNAIISYVSPFSNKLIKIYIIINVHKSVGSYLLDELPYFITYKTAKNNK